jgi:hypothetical protein
VKKEPMKPKEEKRGTRSSKEAEEERQEKEKEEAPKKKVQDAFQSGRSSIFSTLLFLGFQTWFKNV